MTWLVLRYWYGYHRAKYQKWDGRKFRWDEKKWKQRANRVRRERRIYRKYEHHAFWFHHYAELGNAYGHEIVCIHFGEGENTIQSGRCPYQEDECKRCDGRIYLGSGVWCHYLSFYDDGFTPRNDHTPEPKLSHWPHQAGKVCADVV